MSAGSWLSDDSDLRGLHHSPSFEERLRSNRRVEAGVDEAGEMRALGCVGVDYICGAGVAGVVGRESWTVVVSGDVDRNSAIKPPA